MNPADIVERLRDNEKWHTWEDLTGLIAEAAEEIERLHKINTKLQRDLSDRISDIFEHDAEVERLRAARDVALEEAAKVAWEHDDDVGAVIADAIRALKEKTHESG